MKRRKYFHLTYIDSKDYTTKMSKLRTNKESSKGRDNFSRDNQLFHLNDFIIIKFYTYSLDKKMTSYLYTDTLLKIETSSEDISVYIVL